VGWGRGQGEKGWGNSTNVQYKPIWNCHNESPPYNKYILIFKNAIDLHIYGQILCINLKNEKLLELKEKCSQEGGEGLSSHNGFIAVTLTELLGG
jgi:hypothetical protein